MKLGLFHPTLQKIKTANHSDPDRCLTDMLSHWLNRADHVDTKGGPTLDTLALALKDMGYTAACDNISKQSNNCISLNRLIYCIGISGIVTFDQLLDTTPSVIEISELVKTDHWYKLGVQLHVDEVNLTEIEDMNHMYQLWLSTQPTSATRRQLLVALRDIGEDLVANEYEHKLMTQVSNS